MRYDDLDMESKLELYRRMRLSRAFEEKVNELFMQSKIHGTTHLGIGQEAGHAGLGAALELQDWILPTHRGHGHFLGRGGDPGELMLELAGSRRGTNKGLGGSMHLIDLEHNNMGSSGIVAGAVPIAAGMAFALKRNGRDAIVAVCLGDGACNQGMALETFNLAGVWGVPLLFFNENNQYAMSAPVSRFAAGGSLAGRAAAFGMKSEAIDGNDLPAVFDAVSRAREEIMGGGGPYFIESVTYRQLGHSKSDLRRYRTRQEEDEWKERCPIARNRALLISLGADIATLDGLDAVALGEVEEAASAALGDGAPGLRLEEALGLV